MLLSSICIATFVKSSSCLRRPCYHLCRLAVVISLLPPARFAPPTPPLPSLPLPLRLKATSYIHINKFAPPPFLPYCHCICRLVATVTTVSLSRRLLLPSCCRHCLCLPTTAANSSLRRCRLCLCRLVTDIAVVCIV